MDTTTDRPDRARQRPDRGLHETAHRLLREHLPAAVELRHALHRRPGAGGDEGETVACLRRWLAPLRGVDALDGLLVDVGTPGRPAVGVRAELDALEIQESSGVAWASEKPGVAHLCGHDVHMAALAAVVRTVAELPGVARLLAVFQPREETAPSGAHDLVEHGLLGDHDVRAMLAVHLQPALARRVASADPGAINAAADFFTITVTGRAAHAAYPHLGRDPVVAAAALVQSLQHLTSRRVDPMHAAVVTIGAIHGGSSANAIPDRVTLSGTLRSFDPADRALLLADLRVVAEAVARAHGCAADVEVEGGEPVLVNDPDLAAAVSDALAAAGFARGATFRSCGADDFAFYGERCPSLMIFLGTGDGDRGAPGLHHPAFVPGDDTVEAAATAMLTAFLATSALILPDRAAAT